MVRGLYASDSTPPRKQAHARPAHRDPVRMVMSGHTCPCGLKARSLLQRKEFVVDDRWLKTRQEVDAFKTEHGVKKTPQIFIHGARVGGYGDRRRRFGISVSEHGAVSHRPVAAVFAVTALTAIAASTAAFELPFCGHTVF